MQDGRTKKVRREPPVQEDPNAFLTVHRAVIVTLAGTTAGNEYELEQDRTTVGRGPGVDLAFDDRTMSREHGAFEVMDGAMWLRDLGSTNGVLVNGGKTLNTELKHGDRIELGDHQFQFVLEPRRRDPKTYELENE
jgi:pSer/pThr/pTyr-binding forkhead associated (FHA) protein